ncbi:MAG TPA: phospholipase D-like domain-containing protein [Bryobacteraceae bacterium]|nr:phospholipase D-like domain-containing protein [Bryobacteraceae bacterium]
MKKRHDTQTLFTRSTSVGEAIERMIRTSKNSVDAALYRLSNPRLARALHDAGRRGVRVRVILDREKYATTTATRELLAKFQIPHRLMSGRRGRFAKMHHKFAILDGRTAVTGSYNWTLESERENFECLLVLRDQRQVRDFEKEFEALWAAAQRGSPRAAPSTSDV